MPTCARSICISPRRRATAEVELVLSMALLVTLFLMAFAAMRIRMAEANVLESAQQQAYSQAIAGGGLQLTPSLTLHQLVVAAQVATPGNVPPLTALPNDAYTGSARATVGVFIGPDGWMREGPPGDGAFQTRIQRRFQMVGPSWSIDGHAQPLRYRGRIRSWRTALTDRNLGTLFAPLKLSRVD